MSQPMLNFANNLALLAREPNLPPLAARGWLHRLLAWQIRVTRATYGALADDEYRGLYVPNAEADLLGAGFPEPPPDLAAERAALEQERDAIERADDALVRVGRLFGLSRLERDVLLLALLPEIDLRYERIIAYIQDDVTKKRPTVDLALRLLCTSPEDVIAARASFSQAGPLLRNRLIQLYEDGQRQAPLLARFVKIDERIATELLGSQPDAIDSALLGAVTLTRPTRALASLILTEDLVARLRRAWLVAERPALALQGHYGSGRRALAEALCTLSNQPLLQVRIDHLIAQSQSPDEAMRRVVREASLHCAAILWLGADRLLHPAPGAEASEAGPSWMGALLAALEEHVGGSFLAIEQPWEARGQLPGRRYLRVELPAPSYAEREQLWRRRLNGDSPDDATLAALASTFRLSGGQIRDAAAQARALAAWQSEQAQPQLTRHELYAASRAQSSGRLDALAQKIRATYAWDDIVLPADQVRQLQEICIQVRHRRTVLEAWGFERRLAMGKGVNVLFAGQSGTGKTMAAEIIAADLGLELYKIDLSSMVSKYIGETEKNLDRVFTAAREANAILFFDEADAIFGKRSEVKDAHDRYANIEVSYLLQKMEEYDGVVILATNLRKNLDDAFVRRLHVAIDFPVPEEADRLRIWSKVFPAAAPLDADVDLALLAKQFKLTGGNIRNVALLAAYLAAEDGAAIGMAQIMRALRREYQKLGKLVTEAEFGKWVGRANHEDTKARSF